MLCITPLLLALYAAALPNRWEAYLANKLNEPAREFVVRALQGLPCAKEGQVAFDIGAGVGHETLLLLDMGFDVVAIDKQEIAFEFMLKREELIKHQSHLKTCVCAFEDLDFSLLPDAHIVISSFALPFCHPSHFDTFWQDLSGKIAPGGHFIGNIFDPGFTAFSAKDRRQMTFHTLEQALNLFKNFKILSFKEIREGGKASGTFDHYYEVVAEKI